MLWILHNYYKDKEEDFESTKWICSFLNPGQAQKVFEDSGETVTQVSEDAFLKEIKENASGNFDMNNIKDNMEDMPSDTESDNSFIDDAYNDLDTIERIGD